jgi:hypothetical protein
MNNPFLHRKAFAFAPADVHPPLLCFSSLRISIFTGNVACGLSESVRFFADVCRNRDRDVAALGFKHRNLKIAALLEWLC